MNPKSKKDLDQLLAKRKKKLKLKTSVVINIIRDVKKNGDKAILKYEKKFNNNKIIVPSKKQILKSITFLDKKVKNAIDLSYKRILKFHSLQKFKRTQ